MLSGKSAGRGYGVFFWAVLLVGSTSATFASAQERKAYRYVDEKGRVVYSQTPPAGSSAKQVDIAPAYRGSGGNNSPFQYDEPRGYSTMGDDRYAQSVREQQRRAEEARLQRLAELEAECVRNRGVDCKNPETLRLIEASRVPGGRRF